MSKRSKEEFLAWCRSRYPKRDRKGKSRMLDEVCDTLGWNRKHAIKALKALVSLGRQAKKRGRQPRYGPCVGRGGHGEKSGPADCVHRAGVVGSHGRPSLRAAPQSLAELLQCDGGGTGMQGSQQGPETYRILTDCSDQAIQIRRIPHDSTIASKR